MLTDGPVHCFVGYSDRLEKMMEEVSLRDQVSKGGSIFHRLHLYDYSRHLFHTKESEAVVQRSQLKFDPDAKEKTMNINNIKYILGHRKEQDDSYFMKLTMDLLIGGYNCRAAPRSF